LSESDVRVLLALADENPNGKITWKEFIPVGIKAIQIFLERNKKLAKIEEDQRDIKKETLKLIFEFEIKKCNQLILRRL
jgi:hypothetical protein